MARHDPDARAAERARGGDEVALAQDEHLRACLPRVPTPEEKHDDNEHVAEPRPPHHGEDDREDVDVDRQRHIGDPHDERVHPATAVPRDHTERGSERAREHDSEERRDERDPRPMDDPAQDVASELVGAERTFGHAVGEPRRRRELESEVGRRRRLRRQVGRQHPDAHERGEDRERKDEDLPPPQESQRVDVSARDRRGLGGARHRVDGDDGAGVSGADGRHPRRTVVSAWSMRGSIQMYRRSMTRFMPTYIISKSSRITWMTGTSRNATDSITSWPTPGQAYTVSVTTAPARSPTKTRPAYVSGGMSAIRRACFQTTPDSRRPLARAVATYAWPGGSNVAQRPR